MGPTGGEGFASALSETNPENGYENEDVGHQDNRKTGNPIKNE